MLRNERMLALAWCYRISHYRLLLKRHHPIEVHLMPEFKHTFVNTNGIKMHLVEAGQGFPVVMCHGFPELWYSWRHQIRALADAGFRAIAPDQRGYGETECPPPIDAYTQTEVVTDII